MQWEFTNDRAISSQIVEIIQKGILSGVYPPGSSLPSVRVLAVEAGVNPNTMQKALAELETQGLVRTQRNSGRTVTNDERLIMKLKEQAAARYVEQYFTHMQSLGITRGDAASTLQSQVGEVS
ncbi:MAG: GntR family transcriptional regulator [Propionibacteriaceae bacterium]|nr:GntR family transcriptional regulator [Propionibacteriaceae bacterium]